MAGFNAAQKNTAAYSRFGKLKYILAAGILNLKLGHSSGGFMCKHKKFELIARLDNYQGHKSINLYSCKNCDSTLVLKNNSTPMVLNGEFRSRQAVRELAEAS